MWGAAAIDKGSEDGPEQRALGEYELAAHRAKFTQMVSGFENETAELEYVIADGLVFMHSPGWPAAIRKCWLVVDDALDPGALEGRVPVELELDDGSVRSMSIQARTSSRR